MTYRNELTERLYQAIVSLQTVEDCYRFFDDVCTVKEIMDMSQRLEVARQLSQGKSYQSITEAVGASSATIGRVKRCLDYGAGGYAAALAAPDKREKE